MTEAKNSNKLEAFVYVLLRDHLTFGAINGILQRVSDADECVLSDEFAAAKARDIVEDLLCPN